MKYISTLLFLFLIPFLTEESPLPEKTYPSSAESWTLLSDHTVATVYNAVEAQCNGNPLVTASRYRIDPDKISELRILAMERTMMAEFSLSYGDIVRVEGAGAYDGLWQIQDTMNKRFKGQHKIDFLVPSSVRTGKWRDVKVFLPGDDLTRDAARKQLSI